MQSSDQIRLAIDGLALECPDMVIRMNPPATDEQIQSQSEVSECDVPSSLQAWYRIANGGELQYLSLVPAHECSAVHPDRPWCSFHSWGDGNFDWVVGPADPDYAEGTVVFCDHETGKHTSVCDSITSWFIGVVDELKEQGEVWMPFDYPVTNKGRPGLYMNVLRMLKE